MPPLSGNGVNREKMADFENKIENKIKVDGDSDFLKLVNGKNQDTVFKFIDELMEAVKVLHPRMFNSVMDRISKN